MSTTSYLEQYDAAADTEKSYLARRWIDTEPLPFFKELRQKRPILVTPKFTLVTRFDDVREVLSMPKVFTVQPYAPKMADYLMMHDDDALHTREKSLMQSMLNRRRSPKSARNGRERLKGDPRQCQRQYRTGKQLLPHGAGHARTGIFRTYRSETP